jgi:hypothetical protein
MNKKKFFKQLLTNRRNVKYNDFVTLVESFGFEYMRSRGSHNIYGHKLVPEIINLQDIKGEAKDYQINQFLSIVERYQLKMERTEDVK